MIEIGTASAAKGEMGKGVLAVGEMAGGSGLFVPVLILNGLEDGPRLWVTTGVHGDELNGFMSVRRVAKGLDPARMKGALICTPMINPLAMQWRNKVNPYDLLDMCQQFPGKADGQPSQQAAYMLFEHIKAQADYLIDFHTAGTQFYADPYTVFKYIPSIDDRVNRESQELALAFQTKINCRVDVSAAGSELPGGISGNLDVNCLKNGIPAFMAEIGSGGKFEEENIAAGSRGLNNVLKHLGIVPGGVEKESERILITERTFLYCRKAGVLVLDVKPGQIVREGDKLGSIIDFFSELEDIHSSQDSIIFQVRTNPIVHTGDRLGMAGLKWQEISA